MVLIRHYEVRLVLLHDRRVQGVQILQNLVYLLVGLFDVIWRRDQMVKTATFGAEVAMTALFLSKTIFSF